MDINKKALARTANNLRVSEPDAHTIITEYYRNLDEHTVSGETIAVRYGRSWYVVGTKVNGSKNVPKGIEVVDVT